MMLLLSQTTWLPARRPAAAGIETVRESGHRPRLQNEQFTSAVKQNSMSCGRPKPDSIARAACATCWTCSSESELRCRGFSATSTRCSSPRPCPESIALAFRTASCDFHRFFDDGKAVRRKTLTNQAFAHAENGVDDNLMWRASVGIAGETDTGLPCVDHLLHDDGHARCR